MEPKMKCRTSFLLVCVAAWTGLSRAADRPPKAETYLTPRTAGPDFLIQGEFNGTKDQGPDKNLGAQVIALGKGTFRLVLLPGGLPGSGWDAKTRIEIEGKSDGEQAVFTAAEGEATATEMALSGQHAKLGKFELKKVTRKSVTLGAKPPPGAIVLFNGSNADEFVNGHMDERKLLESGPRSKRLFTNFTLHVEFLLPFKPEGRGQDRGNSGVYLQDRYEIQVLDSFGLKGLNNECGAIYSKTAPSVNLCFPPLQWQTYDAYFTAAQFDADGKKTENAIVTLRHNGVIVLDHVEISGPTGGGKPESPAGGALQLQGHGNPVFYRNIWIVPKD
jgi:3-keto-disaccharide hydrolase